MVWHLAWVTHPPHPWSPEATYRCPYKSSHNYADHLSGCPATYSQGSPWSYFLSTAGFQVCLLLFTMKIYFTYYSFHFIIIFLKSHCCTVTVLCISLNTQSRAFLKMFCFVCLFYQANLIGEDSATASHNCLALEQSAFCFCHSSIKTRIGPLEFGLVLTFVFNAYHPSYIAFKPLWTIFINEFDKSLPCLPRICWELS